MSATLASIRIKNFALVENLVWNPGPGFNAVSGETGAGKSILIGALKLLLGERADRSLLRAGAEQCTIEALFISNDFSTIDSLLEESGVEPCEEGQLIVKRTFGSSSGRQFVNGSPCNISLLKTLGDLLVDLHGPHDHQSLFSREEQTRLLDAFSGLENVSEQYQRIRVEWLALLREKEAMESGARERTRELDLLLHQTEEIEAAGLREGEDEELSIRHRAAANARKIQEQGAAALGLLRDAEPCLVSFSGELGRLLRDLGKLDERAQALESRQVEIHEQLGDLASALEEYLGTVDMDPQALQEIEERMDLLVSLQRKYGNSVAEILAFQEEASNRLQELRGRETRGANLDKEIADAASRLAAVAGRLSAGRKKGAARLGKAVAGQLGELGFQRAEFSILLEDCGEHGPHGAELGEFVFAPNPGEPARPLRQIASSGEISRVMLALKCALAAEDRISLLVFDEIDANVGGETATKVGRKMRELGDARQVLCITHLPQVAAAATAHFSVEKVVQSGRTVTGLTPVDGETRELEIARMLGGASESARKHARVLLATESPA